MDSDKDNANPTILNASDLPTRASKETWQPRTDGGTGLFDSLSLSLSDSDAWWPTSSPPTRTASLTQASIPSTTTTEAETKPQSENKDAAEVAAAEEEERIEEIDAQEIYDLIAPISDPEHPLSLGSLSVIQLQDIHVTQHGNYTVVTVLITPTITHCSLATVIGLGVRVRLEQALPPRFRVDVQIKEGTHSTGDAVTKQLGDKERVAAAMENGTLVGVLHKMMATCV